MKHLLTYIMGVVFVAGSYSFEGTSSANEGFVTSLHCARVIDEVTIAIGDNEVVFCEVIKVASIPRREKRIGNQNVASFVIWPILTKDSQRRALLFQVPSPTIVVSDGSLRNVIYSNSDGTNVSDSKYMREDGMHRFEVQFGNEIPKEFTIMITMTVNRARLSGWPELVCRMSDDGRKLLSLKANSKLRLLNTRGSRSFLQLGAHTLHSEIHGWHSIDTNIEYTVRLDELEGSEIGSSRIQGGTNRSDR